MGHSLSEHFPYLCSTHSFDMINFTFSTISLLSIVFNLITFAATTISAQTPQPCAIDISPYLNWAGMKSIRAYCGCRGSTGSGRIFSVESGRQSCVEPCMRTTVGQTCIQANSSSQTTAIFVSCCNSCKGTYKLFQHGSSRRYICGTTTTAPTPTPSPKCAISTREYPDWHGFKTVVQMCTCGRSGRWRHFVVEERVEKCVDTCMLLGVGKPCSWLTFLAASTKHFETCCSSCSGVARSLSNGNYSRYGCAIRATTPSPSPSPSCSLQSLDSKDVHGFKAMSSRCTCGNRGIQRQVLAEESKLTCLESCLHTDDGKPCSLSTFLSNLNARSKKCCEEACSGTGTLSHIGKVQMYVCKAKKDDPETRRLNDCKKCFNEKTSPTCGKSVKRCSQQKPTSSEKQTIPHPGGYFLTQASVRFNTYNGRSLQLDVKSRLKTSNDSIYCSGLSALYTSKSKLKRCSTPLDVHELEITSAGIGITIFDAMEEEEKGFRVVRAFSSVVDGFEKDPDYYPNIDIPHASRVQMKTRKRNETFYFSERGLDLEPLSRGRFDQAAQVTFFCNKSRRREIVRKAMKRFEGKGFRERAFVSTRLFSIKQIKRRKYKVIAPFTPEFVFEFENLF